MYCKRILIVLRDKDACAIIILYENLSITIFKCLTITRSKYKTPETSSVIKTQTKPKNKTTNL